MTNKMPVTEEQCIEELKLEIDAYKKIISGLEDLLLIYDVEFLVLETQKQLDDYRITLREAESHLESLRL